MFVSSLFSLLIACQNPPPAPGTLERTGQVLTTVNGQPITQGMVDGMLSQFPAEVRDKVIAQGQTGRLKDELITTEVLYQKALEQKLHEKSDVKMLIAFSERQALARALVEQVVQERSTDAAAKAWYDEHAVQFRRSQAKLRHIMVKDQAEADAIMKELSGGGNFAEIAAQKSLDTRTAKDGGSMGWMDVKNLTPEMSAAIATAADGAIVGPIASKGGFHILQVEAKRDAVPMEEVMDQIKPKLREDIINSYIEELKKAATITAADAPAGGATVAPGAPAAPAAPAAPTGK